MNSTSSLPTSGKVGGCATKISDVDTLVFSYYPIESSRLEKMYQDLKRIMWVPEEILLAKDQEHFSLLDEKTQNFVTFILCFFSQADGIIVKNLVENFIREASRYKEAAKFLTAQAYNELIHSETYGNLINALITNPKKQREAYDAIHYIPTIGLIGEWMMKWMSDDIPLAERVVAFACVEGMLFTAAFAGVYWIKRKNVLPGLCKANEFIARDEALHTRFAGCLYEEMTRSGDFEVVPQDRIHSIIREGVEVARNFIESALKVDLIGLTSEGMVQYTMCTADALAEMFGVDKIYDVPNPYEWMLILGLPNTTNFFESMVTEYSKPSGGLTIDFESEIDC